MSAVNTNDTWVVDPEYKTACFIRTKGGELIAEVENEEHARLIAAAPELLDAVKPFAKLLKEHHQRLSDDQPIYGVGESLITVGDLRRAVNASTQATGGQS